MSEPNGQITRYAFGYSDERPSFMFMILIGVASIVVLGILVLVVTIGLEGQSGQHMLNASSSGLTQPDIGSQQQVEVRRSY